MNILILNWRDTSHPKSGGAEIVTMEHARRWVMAGHTVTWITSVYERAKKSEIIDGVVIVRRAGSWTIYPYVLFYLLVNAHRFDVIIDEIHGIPFFASLVTKKPVIVFIHEIAGEIWNYMFSFPFNLIGRFLEKLYFKLYQNSLFWTDSPSMAKELTEHGILSKNITTISCPVTIDPNILNKIINITKESKPTFLFVSRLVRMKGIEEVIKAFSFIIHEEPEAQLWIVGGGETSYINLLEVMMREYGIGQRVTLFGKVTEEKKYELLRRSHILLHASVKEGWGLVVLEAALCGTPAVVYNVTGLRDVVKHGLTGIVVSSNSPLDMAREALLLEADQKRYKQYQDKGKQWVNSLTWDEAAKQSILLLEKAQRER